MLSICRPCWTPSDHPELCRSIHILISPWFPTQVKSPLSARAIHVSTVLLRASVTFQVVCLPWARRHSPLGLFCLCSLLNPHTWSSAWHTEHIDSHLVLMFPHQWVISFLLFLLLSSLSKLYILLKRANVSYIFMNTFQIINTISTALCVTSKPTPKEGDLFFIFYFSIYQWTILWVVFMSTTI